MSFEGWSESTADGKEWTSRLGVLFGMSFPCLLPSCVVLKKDFDHENSLVLVHLGFLR